MKKKLNQNITPFSISDPPFVCFAVNRDIERTADLAPFRTSSSLTSQAWTLDTHTNSSACRPAIGMADVAVVVASSLPFSSTSAPTQKPSPPPHRRRLCPPPKPLSRPPLLSDVHRDLTADSPTSTDAASSRHLLKYYARLASNLAGSGRLRDFLMIAESVLTSDAVAAGRSHFLARIDAGMVARGIASVVRDRNLGEVLHFLSDAEKLGIRTSSLFSEPAREAMGAECLRLVDERRLEEFVGLMETLAGYGLFIRDIVDPVNILKIFVEKRDPNMAIRYASLFPHSQLLFCSIIQEFGKKKDMLSAIRVFEASKQNFGGINMFAYRSIIDTCGLCGDFLKSRSIFEELLSQKITPNIYVFNSLMNVNAHDLSYTLYVYKHMQNLGVTADMTSYNIFLKACCNAKNVDLAQDIYKEIKHMASKGTLKLDVITYSSLIKVFADAKMWQMSLSIKEDMLLANVHPNIVTWSSLISACANAGLVDHAVQVFEEMLRAGCEPNAQCCNILLYACVSSCQYDRAFRLFHNWKETGFKICHTAKGRRYDVMHVGLTIKHPTQNGSSCLASIHEPQPQSVVVPFKPTVATFNILMKACGTDYRRAKALMDEMKMMGLSPDNISWSTLIDIYGISQNMRGAMQAFKTMRDVGIKPDVVAYTTAIKACVQNKNLKIAFSLFEEMKRYRIRPNLVTYNTLLRARSTYGSLREVQQCLAIYQDMRKAGYSANDYYLKELIEEWCEGVICNSNQNQSLLTVGNNYKKTDTKKHHSLLEKVAALLQQDACDNQAIDIRGLTKVEARIVVLSVLQMIKESYQIGDAVKDDLIIISGVGKESTHPANHEPEVRHAIIKVLRDELGLDVMTGHGTVHRDHAPVPHNVDYSAVLQKAELPKYSKYLPRRPLDLGLLKVTRKSLNDWLQRKVSP